MEEHKTVNAHQRSIAATASKATTDLDAESVEDGLAEGVDNDDLLELLEIMGMDDATEIMAKIPTREEDEDSESFQIMPGHSDDLASREAPPKSRRKGKNTMEKDTMEEAEEKRRFIRLVKTCPYCGRLYSFRTDQSEPPTCGMARCIASFEESSKEKAVVK